MKELKKWSKAIIPMSLFLMTCGVAGEEVADCCPQTNCCPPTCCKPCCVPQPKKCIDCECYSPQYYELQCAWGLFVEVDFLYWYARETNLEFAYSRRLIPQPTNLAGACTESFGYDTNHHYCKTEWRPGVRVGIGFNSDCDGWDTCLNWTYIDNHVSSRTTDTTIVIGQTFADSFCQEQVKLVQPWFNGDGQPLVGNDFVAGAPTLFPAIGAKWSLIFNQIDWEIGRKYWLSKCMLMRPYLGIRGAWTHTNFHVQAELFDPTIQTVVVGGDTIVSGPEFTVNNNLFKNRFWGVGLLGGLQPEFVFGNWCGCGNFSLYGNIEGALIWGKYTGNNHVLFVNNLTQTTNAVNTSLNRFANPVERDSYARMQGILDLGIGIRWQEFWCCDRYSTSIDLGWEHHYWFDFGLYHRPGCTASEDLRVVVNPGAVLRFPLTNNAYATNLGFGGLVIRFRFDF